MPQDEGKNSGNVVQLSEEEEQQVKERVGVRAAVIFEAVRREGEQELTRPALGLALSGLAAGLSMGFSLLASGVLYAYLPDSPWRPLVVNLGYTVGFLIVILGQQQLYTENTLTAVMPVLDDEDKPKKLLQMVRLWAIVLVCNLIGAAGFAILAAHTVTFDPKIKAAFLQLGLLALHPTFWEILWRGIIAAWLIALVAWLMPGAEKQRVWIIVILTWLVGVTGLSHVIAGSVDALYAVSAGAWPWTSYVVSYLIPVFIGNTIGGVFFVALLNYGQVVPEQNSSNKR